MGYGPPPPDWSTPGPPPYPPSGGGYGGPPGGGYGGPYRPGFPPPGPPRRKASPLILLAAAFAVLVIAGAVVVVLLTRGNGEDRPTVAPTTAGVAPGPVDSATPTPSDSGSPSATPTPNNTFKPTVAGWQVIVASTSNGLSYDVPAYWKNNGEDTVIGLDDGSDVPGTTVTFSAESRKNRCMLGGAGFHATKVDSIRSSAIQAAQQWATSASYKVGSPRKTIGSPQSIKLSKLNEAVQITARVSNAPDSDNCGSTGTTIRIVVLPLRTGGSLLFVLYVHTGQPGVLGDGDMDKVVHSVRLAK